MTVALLVVAATAVVIGTGSLEDVKAQMTTSNMTGSQNQTNMMTRMGPNITGSIPIGPTIAKAIASQVHVSLANASETAEKAVGANAHSTAVRIGVVQGFLVYMALVIDNNNNFHGVLVDPGTGKVLTSAPMSMEAMASSGMGINLMGPGMMGPNMLFLQPRQVGPGMMGPQTAVPVPGMMGPQTAVPVPGMMGPQTAVPVPGMMGPGMSGYGAGMIQHGMMKGPGMMRSHP